jgi:hypothetical protein
MKLSSVSNKYKQGDNRSLWQFTQNLKPGDINCVVGNKEKKVMEIFYKLIHTFSTERGVCYLVNKRQYGRQNLYLSCQNVSQSEPLDSFSEIENQIINYVRLYDNPIFFIKDYFKIAIGSNYWEKSNDNAFQEAAEKIQKMAQKNKVTIYTFMFFGSPEIVKEYFLQFEMKREGLFRSRPRNFFFAKQFCLFRSNDYSYKACRQLHKQLILDHPELKRIEKGFTITSILGYEGRVWFHPRFPDIYICAPLLFDLRLIPEVYKGYHVTYCLNSSPRRYFYRDKTLSYHERYSPENLSNFVDNHLELISWKLNRPLLTKEEALDALTGGFDKHIQRCLEEAQEVNDQFNKSKNNS